VLSAQLLKNSSPPQLVIKRKINVDSVEKALIICFLSYDYGIQIFDKLNSEMV
jgi:hypothetical protein